MVARSLGKMCMTEALEPSRTGKLNIRKNCLLPPLSSIISTKPGFNCSIDGTWFDSMPISPDSAGTLTWTLQGIRRYSSAVNGFNSLLRLDRTYTSVDL